jgi:phosphatidate cytidylyltransferase
MRPSDPAPDSPPPPLRAAHRARHAAAAPEPDVETERRRTGPNGAPSSGLAAEAGFASDAGFSSANGFAAETAELYSRREAAERFGSDPADAPAADRPESDGPPDEPADELPLLTEKKSRAGRDLTAAFTVALGLGGAALASLLLFKPAFYVIIFAAVGVATWEMVRAIHSTGPKPPFAPLLLGGPAMVGLTVWGGSEALLYGLLGTVIAVFVWRLADGPEHYNRDVVPGLLVAMYVPFLGCFVALLLDPPDGHWRVIAMLVTVVLSDTGGYVAGVFLGKHPMAPRVSPKKSWEGFGGSLLASGAGAALMLYFMFDVAWWGGFVFGVAVAASATLGDLAESLLKRDLGIKDMSSLLPGHGGLMDRLDSILFAAPAAYALLTWLASPG